MWFYIFLGIALLLGVGIYLILRKQIIDLVNENSKLKYEYEDKILTILGDMKELENRYATSGTAMCRYLDNAINYHNKMYYKYKNELNIATNDIV